MNFCDSTQGGDSEDFGLANARRILDKYRPEIACFNDDVQGTGVITLAGIMAGLHVSGLKLTDMRMVVFGSGTAGIGIADQVRDAIAAEGGKSKEDAAKQIWSVLLNEEPTMTGAYRILLGVWTSRDFYSNLKAMTSQLAKAHSLATTKSGREKTTTISFP